MKLFLINLCLTVVIATSSGWCRGEKSSSPIQLLDVVEVNHPMVVLADLLPRDAPPAMRAASSTIALCPAPQPGSVRILRSEQVMTVMTAHTDLPRRVVAPPTVIVRSCGWPIRKADVRDAISRYLRAHGSSSLPDMGMLELPPFLAATAQNVQLQVTHLQLDSRQQAMEARVRCSNRKSCASFLAHVVLPQSADWPAELVRTISANSAAISATSLPVVARAPLVARGKTATLILEDATMRISIPVICLEPGLLNQRIRVVDRRSRRVFLAEVIGDHLLRASL